MRRPAPSPSSGNSAHSSGSARRHRYRLPPVRPKTRITPLTTTATTTTMSPHSSPRVAKSVASPMVMTTSSSVKNTDSTSLSAEPPKVEAPAKEEKKEDQLPEGWVEAKDPASGKSYFYNAFMGVTSWERPSVPPPTSIEPEQTQPEQPVQQPETESVVLEAQVVVSKTVAVTEVVSKTVDVAEAPKENAAQPDTEEIPIKNNGFTDPSSETGDSAFAEKDDTALSVASVGQQQALPDGWVEAQDPSSGKSYFYNASTGLTSWERPSLPTSDQSTSGTMPEVTVPQVDILPDGWEEMVDPSSGRTYYYHSQTNETSWERPLPPSAESAVEESREQSKEQTITSDEPLVESGENMPETSSEAPMADLSSPEDVVAKDHQTAPEELTENQPMDEADTKPEDVAPESVAESTTELPPGWVEATDPSSGKVYFYNASTSETRWERPLPIEPALESNEAEGASSEVGKDDEVEAMTSTPSVESEQATEEVVPQPESISNENESAVKVAPETEVAKELPEAWVEATDPSSGRAYFYNTKTGETSWERPAARTDDESVREETNQESGVGNSALPAESTNLDAAAVNSTAEEGEDSGLRDTQATDDTEVDAETDDPTAVMEHSSVNNDGVTEVDAFSTTQVLKKGWIETTDPASGQIYYFNPATNETSWEKPLESPKSVEREAATARDLQPPETEDQAITEEAGAPQLPDNMQHEDVNADPSHASVGLATDPSLEELVTEHDEPADLPEGWIEAKDPSSGRTYYYDTATNETSWERPPLPTKEIDDEQEVLHSDPKHPSQSPEIETEGNATAELGPTQSNAEMDQSSVDPSHVSQQDPGFASAEAPEPEMENSVLPAGWVEGTDPSSGQTFYYNAKTNETSWEKPASSAIDEFTEEPETESFPAEHASVAGSHGGDDLTQNVQSTEHDSHASSLPPGWSKATDPSSGKTYFFNSTTNESSWERPTVSSSMDDPVQTADELSPQQESQAEAFAENGTSDEFPEEVSQRSKGKDEMKPETHPSPDQVQTAEGDGEIVFESGASPDEDVSVPQENTGGLFNSPDVWDASSRDPDGMDKADEPKVATEIDAELPEGWVKSSDPTSGKIYYYNAMTNESSWERPSVAASVVEEDQHDGVVEEAGSVRGEDVHTRNYVPSETDSPEAEIPLSASATNDGENEKAHEDEVGTVSSKNTAGVSASDLAPGWVEVSDPSTGQIYYYNSATEESAWERPTTENVGDSGTSQPELLAARAKTRDQNEAEEDELGPSLTNTENDGRKESENMEHNSAVDETTGISSSRDLLPGWEEAKDPNTGDIYYFNPETNETSWDRPVSGEGVSAESHAVSQNDATAVPSDVSDDVKQTHPSNENVIEEHSEVKDPLESEESLPAGWVKTEDPASGNIYYYNSETNETSWDHPGSKSVRSGVDASDSIQEVQSEMTGMLAREQDSNTVQSANAQSRSRAVDAPVDSEPSKDTDLPLGWEAVTDPTSGETYFYNQNTGETSWDRPGSDSTVDRPAPGSIDEKESQSVAEKSLGLPDGWIEETDPSTGEMYYYNTTTNETSWERPVNRVAGSHDTQIAVDKTEDINPSRDETPTEDGSVDANKSATTAEPLPLGWEEVIDPNTQKPYYYNSNTDETSWSRPTKSQSSTIGLSEPTSEDKAPENDLPQGWEEVGHEKAEVNDASATGSSTPKELPEGWVEAIDPSTQQSYYYNASTGETSWTIPQNDRAVSDSWEVVSKGTPDDAAGEETIAKSTAASSSRKKAAGRPKHTPICLGFGGQLCRIATGRSSHVEIRKLHKSVVNDTFVDGTLEKHLHGIHGPLRKADDEKVNSYLFHHESDLLWKLIQIASKAQGRLRSLNGVSDPSTPESKIVKLLLSILSKEQANNEHQGKLRWADGITLVIIVSHPFV